MTKHPQSRKQQPRLMDHVSDSDDDEEIPEDEAFNSEDERRYGSFFQSTSSEPYKTTGDDDSSHDEDDSEEESDSEDEDGIATDDDEDSEGGDGGQYMLDLLNKLDSSATTFQNKKDAHFSNSSSSSSAKLATNVKESEFSSSVVRGTNLTLDALMEGLEDTRGFGVMQKTMKDVAMGQATSAPVSRTVSDRAQRKVHYQDQSQEVSQWIDAVKQNRQAESLDFRPKERMQVTREELVDKFVPTTDFEKELSAALEKAGQQDEESILKQEQALLEQDDDLGSNKLTMEEYKKRRGQLAKIRALMFYHEQKRHHINKIKSKKYRRIRKRQRERQKEAEVNAQMEENPDMVRELEEKEEMERMKERMTLAHKNTSKWAKRVLKRGKNVDIDTRRALSAQLKRGDDLRKKMNATRDDDDKEEDDDDEEDLVETARKVLADTEDSSHDPPVQKTGLFKLSFMQRGIEKQRERAKEEARQLLRELEDNENDSDEAIEKLDDDEQAGDTKGTKRKKAKVASAAEMKKLLPDGQLVASSLEFGNSNSIAITGDINIDLPISDKPSEERMEQERKSTHEKGSSSHAGTLAVATSTEGNVRTSGATSIDSRIESSKGKDSRSALALQAEGIEDDPSNPWVASTSGKSDAGAREKKKRMKSRRVGKNGIVDVESAVDLMDDEDIDSRRNGKKRDIIDGEFTEEEKKESDDPSTRQIASLTQEELVRRAFAAPTERQVEEEFSKEKEAMEERDDPTRKQAADAKVVSGWGSWAGEGAPPPKLPRKLPKHLKPPEKKLSKRKRHDEKKPNVIINEKRLKKTANNFQIAHIPYPYSSREEYERAMTGGVGPEWNVSQSVKNMTRPDIVTRAGKVIQPLSKKVKAKRAPAKF